jgi:N-acyl-phosphatidylethanolamine-hydrolysing phospholipase D
MKRLIIALLFSLTYWCGNEMKAANSIFDDVKPKHHTATGFRNYPYEADGQASASLGIGFFLRRLRGSLFPPEVQADHTVPKTETMRALKDLKGRNTVTWLGHSAFLIRIDGITILTDPFLTQNAFPYTWGGPKRFVPPGIDIDNLPPIDILLISHDHHDHLDPKTIRALPHKERIAVMVPLGLKGFFEKDNYRIIRELDWFERISIDGFTVTALPAIHNSGRGLNSRNATLWCSWSVRNASAGLYFAGDTAYSSQAFKEIGCGYGPFDAALIPIGAYEPRDFMISCHANPEEAVQIGLDVRAKRLIAMHWGTIDLSDEPYWDPPKRFTDAARKAGVSEKDVWVMRIGETRILTEN